MAGAQTPATPTPTPVLHFSHLTPDERTELAEQLWDSLDADAVGPDEEQAAELRR